MSPNVFRAESARDRLRKKACSVPNEHEDRLVIVTHSRHSRPTRLEAVDEKNFTLKGNIIALVGPFTGSKVGIKGSGQDFELRRRFGGDSRQISDRRKRTDKLMLKQ
ncbi:hypothetical protein BDV96DRAFT_599275 [Lophiotrema nucula]|uniref:Uncharacterized protein n=1 Tax=Lophiotrema nucula TaxID=690887 RepID=A0A6A5ZB75_9PLEO|nr:hypothetical protein BDV96DRAFT_599275 [Lophiotrema nucula]